MVECILFLFGWVVKFTSVMFTVKRRFGVFNYYVGESIKGKILHFLG